MGEQGMAADPRVRCANCGITIATQDFATQFNVQIGWGKPAELQAIIQILATKESLIGQGLVNKISCVRMFIVQIADIGKESPYSCRKSGG